MLANSAPPLVYVSSGEDRTFGAVGEGEREHSPIFDIDRIGFDEPALLRWQGGRDIADISGHRRNRDALAARARLDLLQIEHGRERVASHADE